MDKRSENKVNMLTVTGSWLNEHSSQLEYLPGFTESFAEYNRLLDRLTGLAQLKSNGTSGITKTKAQARQALEVGVIETARILKVHASFTNNQVLMNEVDFSQSQLSHTSEQALIVRGEKTIANALQVQPDAEALGLTTERIEALKSLLANFVSKQSTVRTAIINRKDAGEQLEACIDEIDELLKAKIDLLMDLSQNTVPQLYNQYLGAREIIDR